MEIDQDSSFSEEDVIVDGVSQIYKTQKIEVRPPVYPVKKKGILEFENSVLPKHFCMILIGRPESGKSHLTFELLNNPAMYYKKFNRVFFITPTDKIGNIDLKGDPYWSKQFKPEWIEAQISNLNDELSKLYPTYDELQKKYPGDKDPINILFVIDDCVAELRKHQFNPIIKALFYNRRHLVKYGCVSLLLTTQYYVEVPRSIRSVSNYMAIFGCTPLDWRRIQDECIHTKISNNDSIQREIANIFSTQNEFLYINVDQCSFYRGFSNQLNPEENNDKQYKKVKI